MRGAAAVVLVIVAGVSAGRATTRTIDPGRIDAPFDLARGSTLSAFAIRFNLALGVQGRSKAVTFRYGPLADANTVSDAGLVVRFEADADGWGHIHARYGNRTISRSRPRRMQSTSSSAVLVLVDAGGQLNVSHLAGDSPVYPIWKQAIPGWNPAADWRGQFVAEPAHRHVTGLVFWPYAATSQGVCGDGGDDLGESCEVDRTGCVSPCCTDDCELHVLPTPARRRRDDRAVCDVPPAPAVGSTLRLDLQCRLDHRTRAFGVVPQRRGRLVVRDAAGQVLLDLEVPGGTGWRTPADPRAAIHTSPADGALRRLRVDLEPARFRAGLEIVVDGTALRAVPPSGQITAWLRLDDGVLECCGVLQPNADPP